jgi:hypothetical protein
MRAFRDVAQKMVIAVALIVAAASAGCASGGASADWQDRGAGAVEACSAHGGVGAFDDDAVICRDQTAVGERGSRAVAACREHGGVSAFDDDIVICEDESFHRAEGG